MKLYATVTSERASKGQGGNERLDIDITVQDELRRVSVGKILSGRYDGDIYRIKWVPDVRSLDGSDDVILWEGRIGKGNKQKGEYDPYALDGAGDMQD